MAKNVDKIAEALGVTGVREIPDMGGGAFGMGRFAAVLSARLAPSQERRPGRPSDPLCESISTAELQGEPDAGSGPAA
jgi:hypothetical protein